MKALILALAGCVMLLASVSPWLIDPVGGNLSAWQLPVNMGWQFPSAVNVVCNYGLLCLCCAAYCFLMAWRSIKVGPVPFRGAMLLCLLPVALFVLQYLCIDMQAINRLAQRELQWLLINRHFGYSVSALRILLKPFDIDATTIQGRLVLLAEQVSFGAFLPFLGGVLILLNRTRGWATSGERHLFSQLCGTRAPARGPTQPYPTPAPTKNGFPRLPRRHSKGRGEVDKGWGPLWFSIQKSDDHTALPAWWRVVMLMGGVLLMLILARAPLALFCEHQASNSLAGGDYNGALHWLGAASFLNPSLEQAAAYHIQRGQALYFQYGDESSADAHVYLAFTYRQQNDDLSAYQELFAAWRANPTSSWLKDELTITLAKLAEYVHPLNGPPLLRPIDDDSALPWLDLLVEIDPGNVYAHYAAGRIQYDLHNYSVSIEQMNMVASLSSNRDILSSVDTYLGLSAGGQQRFIDERNLLFKAVTLDPYYYNNTAREALSGLH